MNKIKIFALLAALVVALVTTTVVSASVDYSFGCPYPEYAAYNPGANCPVCATGYYGWYCVDYASQLQGGSNYGDINYYTSSCSWDHYSDCNTYGGHEYCHCLTLGYSDHCWNWQHSSPFYP